MVLRAGGANRGEFRWWRSTLGRLSVGIAVNSSKQRVGECPPRILAANGLCDHDGPADVAPRSQCADYAFRRINQPAHGAAQFIGVETQEFLTKEAGLDPLFQTFDARN